MKVFNNRSGMMSTGFVWMIILVTLVIGGLGFIVLNQIAQNYLQPAFGGLANTSSLINSSQLAEYNTYTGRINDFWIAFPIIAFLTLMVWGIVMAVRNKQYEV